MAIPEASAGTSPVVAAGIIHSLGGALLPSLELIVFTLFPHHLVRFAGKFDGSDAKLI